MDVYLPEPKVASVDWSKFLGEYGKIAAVFPHASVSPKTYMNMSSVADFLSNKGFKVVILGTNLPSAKFDWTDRNNSGQYVNLISKTSVIDLMHIVRMSSLVVSNDSFGAHLGVGYGIPTIVFFCSTEDHHNFFCSKSVLKLRPKYLTCWPCSSGSRSSCPVGTYECVKYAPPLDVLELYLKEHGLVS